MVGVKMGFQTEHNNGTTALWNLFFIQPRFNDNIKMNSSINSVVVEVISAFVILLQVVVAVPVSAAVVSVLPLLLVVVALLLIPTILPIVVIKPTHIYPGYHLCFSSKLIL